MPISPFAVARPSLVRRKQPQRSLALSCGKLLEIALGLILFLSSTVAALAQGQINPPVYATGYVPVQTTSTITTRLVNSRNPPSNLNAIAIGPITTWNVVLPNPPFDGQLVVISCPGGSVGTVNVSSTDGSAVLPLTPGPCTAGSTYATLQYTFSQLAWYSLQNALVPTPGPVVFNSTVFYAYATPIQLYVSTAGHDTADCLAPTVSNGHGPCLTLPHACTIATSYDMSGQWLYINLGTNVSGFAGCPITGSLRGSGGNQISGQYIVINGNGSANTTLLGDAFIQDLETSNGSQVILQNIKVHVAANGYGVFAQSKSVVQIGTDVVFDGADSASSTGIHVESGALVETPSTINTTWTGGFKNPYSLGLEGYIEYDPGGGTVTCSGLTVGDSWISQDSNAAYLWGTAWTTSGCGSIGGHPYDVITNSILRNFTTTPQPFPGTGNGYVSGNGRLWPPLLPTVSFSTGLGSGGTAVPSSGSGSYSGHVVLTTTTGTATTGLVTLVFGENSVLSNGGTPAPCIFTPEDGQGGSAASWANGATARTVQSTLGSTQFQWNDNGVNLANNSTINIGYVCSN